MADRVAGDFDYESAGAGYARQRRTDPRIASLVWAALGDARTVLNVGAGAGSYEPVDRQVTAVEPSASMRAQRPAHLSTALDAVAEALPFADDSFEASMAMVTVHQWADAVAGLAELRRVTMGPVVILTFDGDLLDEFWLARYVPELTAAERRRYPAIGVISDVLGGTREISRPPIPIDCVDGFTEAYYARPERFLDAEVRASQSAWGFVDEQVTERAMAALAGDISSGVWDARHGHLRTQPEFIGSLTLITSN